MSKWETSIGRNVPRFYCLTGIRLRRCPDVWVGFLLCFFSKLQIQEKRLTSLESGRTGSRVSRWWVVLESKSGARGRGWTVWGTSPSTTTPDRAATTTTLSHSRNGLSWVRPTVVRRRRVSPTVEPGTSGPTTGAPTPVPVSHGQPSTCGPLLSLTVL